MSDEHEKPAESEAHESGAAESDAAEASSESSASEEPSAPEPAHAHSSGHGGHDDHHEDNPLFHVSPYQLLIKVLVALVVLTILTLILGKMHLGAIGIMIALTIAFVKSILVCTYFMHLKYDNKFNRIVIYTSLVMVGFFFFYAGIDRNEYSPHIDEKRKAEMELAYGSALPWVKEAPAETTE